MLSRDKILKETSPLSIYFVKSGSSGNRLIFRYPYDESFQYDPDLSGLVDPTSEQDRLQLQSVISENDEALCNMFSVNPNLCGQKFEIKINSVRHVGHPMSLLASSTSTNASKHSLKSTNNQHQNTRVHAPHPGQVNLDLSSYDCLTAPNRGHNTGQSDITSFNIVCALRASASYDIVNCYYDLSKRLAIALSFEERRCLYLSKEIKTILATLEERDMANLADDRDQQETQARSMDKKSVNTNQNQYGGSDRNINESVFSLILNRSNLARDLKRVFVSLVTTGIVDIKINNWVSVSFCLPQKVHRLKLMTHKSMPAIGTKDIKRCLLYLRPYHGLLLLQEPQELLDSLPIDASPAFIQLIRVTKSDKNFMDLSVDANLTLMQIFCIVSQLVYWAKATVIYPICDSNIYAIHPLASTGTNSKLVNDFRTRFPESKSLHHYLEDFSEGTSLSQLNSPLLSLVEKHNLLDIVTWLLQRRILTQVHKYIFLVVEKDSPGSKSSNNNNNNNLTTDKLTASHETVNSSPQGIEFTVPNSRLNDLKVSSIPSNSFESSPQMFKNSLTESMAGSMRRYRADSFPESQEDSNYGGVNSSLSSTPNSNLEYPSPGNEANIIRSSSLSSSCPLDNQLGLAGGESVMSALQRAGLSQTGAKTVLAIPSSKTMDDLKLLIRLIPYFDGKHHVEDIMFFENLKRSQVLILCDKFRDILFTCHYEDVAVSQLSPFNSTRQM